MAQLWARETFSKSQKFQKQIEMANCNFKQSKVWRKLFPGQIVSDRSEKWSETESWKQEELFNKIQ